MEFGPYAIQDALELTDVNSRTVCIICAGVMTRAFQLEQLVHALAKAKPNTASCENALWIDKLAHSSKVCTTPTGVLCMSCCDVRRHIAQKLAEDYRDAGVSLWNAEDSAEHCNCCGEAVDCLGRTSFHIVCSREDIAPKLREELLAVIVKTAPKSLMILDDFSEGGLHTLCGCYAEADTAVGHVFASITPTMVTMVLQANPQILDLVDVRGMTAYAPLCESCEFRS